MQEINKETKKQPVLKLKGAHLEKGTLVKFRPLSRNYFGIRVFLAYPEDEWQGNYFEELSERSLDYDEIILFREKNKKGIGLIVSNPNFKKSPLDSNDYFTLYKVLMDKSLYWIDSRHLFPAEE